MFLFSKTKTIWPCFSLAPFILKAIHKSTTQKKNKKTQFDYLVYRFLKRNKKKFQIDHPVSVYIWQYKSIFKTLYYIGLAGYGTSMRLTSLSLSLSLSIYIYMSKVQHAFLRFISLPINLIGQCRKDYTGTLEKWTRMSLRTTMYQSESTSATTADKKS